MRLTPGRRTCRKTLLQYSSLTLLENERYEVEDQTYQKTDYRCKPMCLSAIRMMFVKIILAVCILEGAVV